MQRFQHDCFAFLFIFFLIIKSTTSLFHLWTSSAVWATVARLLDQWALTPDPWPCGSPLQSFTCHDGGHDGGQAWCAATTETGSAPTLSCVQCKHKWNRSQEETFDAKQLSQQNKCDALKSRDDEDAGKKSGYFLEQSGFTHVHTGGKKWSSERRKTKQAAVYFHFSYLPSSSLPRNFRPLSCLHKIERVSQIKSINRSWRRRFSCVHS